MKGSPFMGSGMDLMWELVVQRPATAGKHIGQGVGWGGVGWGGVGWGGVGWGGVGWGGVGWGGVGWGGVGWGGETIDVLV
jgi:hypothetical protein